MPRKKKGKKPGLGRALKNKFGGKPEFENRAQGRTKSKENVVESTFTVIQKENEAAKLRSITEMSSMEEFMDSMKMRDHTQNDELKVVEDLRESVVSREQRHGDALRATERAFNYENLPIPRKPQWDSSTTASELQMAEEQSFVEWRRNLAVWAKQSNLEMTPFEKNLNVWKQLWCVVERAHLLILIVDARNPLAFISRDLFRFVVEVDERKQCLLMLNKADYLSASQRKYWRQYFHSLQIEVLYFSAIKEEIRLDLTTKSHRDQISDFRREQIIENVDGSDCDEILSVQRLIAIFHDVQHEMDLQQIEVGMVGYPNVGKSSVINVLMGAKRVTTGSTPGKTKHFQTLILDDAVTLCDCPGLVFPTLCSSKADMVLNGCIPIDNLTDFISPSRLLLHRVGTQQLNRVYHLRLPTHSKRARLLTVFDVLDSYCHQKKMYNKSKVPNRTEAARILLKDYVRGKTVYVHCPPNLNGKQRDAFYKGIELKEDDDEDIDSEQNILDHDKLNGNGIKEGDEESDGSDHESDDDEDDDDDNGNDEDLAGDQDEEDDDMDDEEFLKLWKHPLDGYAKGVAPSKLRKQQKKARVIRRSEKRKAKHNRAFRHDASNFEHGSNAVIINAIPRQRMVNRPI